MTSRSLHIVHLLIRRWPDGQVQFLIVPHDKWKDQTGHPYLTLPAKKTVADPLAPFLRGTSIETFVDEIAQEELKLDLGDYTLEPELEPTRLEMPSADPRRADRVHHLSHRPMGSLLSVATRCVGAGRDLAFRARGRE